MVLLLYIMDILNLRHVEPLVVVETERDEIRGQMNRYLVLNFLGPSAEAALIRLPGLN